MRRPVPTLNIFCGSTTGGLELLRAFLEVVGREGRDLPILNLGVDTDLGKIAELEEAATGSEEARTRFLRLGEGLDLRGMAENPRLHPEVAATLEGIPKSAIPRSLDRGSQKVFALTLAAFQASWATPGGILDTLQELVKTLQRRKAELGGRKYIVNCTGLGCGGVGGIAPLLMGAALKAIGEINPDFGENLELNLFWVEPWPDETDPRILANARESLDLLEAAQEGRLTIPVPNVGGISRLGGCELFDNVFIASEVTSHGRLSTREFIEALARIIYIWSFDPLGDEAKSRLADRLSLREEKVDGHKRFFQSAGLKGLKLGLEKEFVAAACIRGLEKLLDSAPSHRMDRAVEELFTGHELLPVRLERALSRDPFGRPLLGREDLKAAIEAGLRKEFSEGTSIEVWIGEAISKNLSQLERRIAASRERMEEEARGAVVASLEPYLATLEIREALAFLEALSRKLEGLAEGLNSSLQEPDDTGLRRAIANLEKIRSSWLDRATRSRKAIASLADAAADYIARKARMEVRRAMAVLYNRLGGFVRSKASELDRFLNCLSQAVSRAKAITSSSPPFRVDGKQTVVEPIMEEGDFYMLLGDFMGCSPDEPSRELLAALAKGLTPLERWADDPEGLYRKLEDFFFHRLEDLIALDIPAFVRIKARREKRPEEEVWKELLKRSELHGALWAVDQARLPARKPLSSLTILASPPDMPVSPGGVDIYIPRDGKELVFLKVELGAHKESLRAWRRYRTVPDPEDGRGPIVPAPLKHSEQGG